MAKGKSRETYGNGSVTAIKDAQGKQRVGKDGKPVWRVCVTLGTTTETSIDGSRKRKQHKVQRTFHGTLKEARELARELADEYRDLDLESQGMTFGKAVDAWADSMRVAESCSNEKLRDYLRRLSYLTACLGEKPLAEIKRADVESALAKVKRERNLAQSTLREVFKLCKRVFAYALLNDWLTRNPCDTMQSPRVTGRTDRRSLTAEEVARLAASIDRSIEEGYQAFWDKEQRQEDLGNLEGRTRVEGITTLSFLVGIRLMLATGMRRGEVLGLSWDCVDLDAGQLTVKHSLTSTMVLKEPKTGAGMRTISIDSATVEQLRGWKAFQTEALEISGINNDSRQGASAQQTPVPVCCNSRGGWLSPRNFERWWGTAKTRGYRDEAGVPGVRMHELRHTQATQLLAAGVDVKTVQHRLGHADASLTLNQYGHAVPANDQAASSVILSLMSSRQD